MEIIKKFASEFQIQFVVKLSDTFTDMFRLHLQVFFIIESNFHKYIPSSKIYLIFYSGKSAGTGISIFILSILQHIGSLQSFHNVFTNGCIDNAKRENLEAMFETLYTYGHK